MFKEAIVLAGGFGTRLKGVLSDLPKPMAPIGNKPFLYYLLSYLLEEGIEHVVLSVGYKHEAIKNYFGKRFKNMRLTYALEETPLGTGGGIKKSLSLCKEQAIFVLNGDSFFDVSFDILRRHWRLDRPLILSLCSMRHCSRYGAVEIDSLGKVIAFKEKQYFDQAAINGGVYLMSRDIFENFSLEKEFSFEKEVLEKGLNVIRIQALVFENYFIDIGIPEDYKRAQKELLEIFKS
tara:strand:+ start:3847 stop:4551 length:705 start_codon:yes stop_codon:yes gene_type:complete